MDCYPLDLLIPEMPNFANAFQTPLRVLPLSSLENALLHITLILLLIEESCGASFQVLEVLKKNCTKTWKGSETVHLLKTVKKRALQSEEEEWKALQML